MSLNVVIPYRPANDGLELRYALRSIQTHLKGYCEIWVIGEGFPKWLKNVRLIECSEESVKCPQNILKKLLKGPEKFLRWDDDIYLTKDLNVKDVMYWADGTLSGAIKKAHGSYRTIVENTAYKVTEDFPYYDVHAPMVMERYILKMLNGYDWDRRYLVKTLYAYHAGVSPTQLEDIKISQPGQEIKEGLFFSTGPHGLEPRTIEYLQAKFPNRSQYEC